MRLDMTGFGALIADALTTELTRQRFEKTGNAPMIEELDRYEPERLLITGIIRLDELVIALERVIEAEVEMGAANEPDELLLTEVAPDPLKGADRPCPHGIEAGLYCFDCASERAHAGDEPLDAHEGRAEDGADGDGVSF